MYTLIHKLKRDAVISLSFERHLLVRSGPSRVPRVDPQATSVSTAATSATPASSIATTSAITPSAYRRKQLLTSVAIGVKEIYAYVTSTSTATSTSAAPGALLRALPAHVALALAVIAGDVTLLRAVPGDVALLLTVEALVSATLGALAREVTLLAALEALGRSSVVLVVGVVLAAVAASPAVATSATIVAYDKTILVTCNLLN
jgi:hypothetical protein